MSPKTAIDPDTEGEGEISSFILMVSVPILTVVFLCLFFRFVHAPSPPAQLSCSDDQLVLMSNQAIMSICHHRIEKIEIILKPQMPDS
ncbi:hypothetical protein AB4254_08355 [Vibrio breoganii]